MMRTRRKGSLKSRTEFRRRGTAAVEFAVLAPVLILVVLGTIDVGQFVNLGQIVSNASREGARTASRDTTLTVSEVQSAVQNYLATAFPAVPTSSWSTALQVNVTDGYGNPISGGDLTTISSGGRISVQVVLTFDTVRWSRGFAGLDGRSLRAITVMRRE